MAKRTPPSKAREVLALALQPDPPSLREMERLTDLSKETCRQILKRNQALMDEYRQLKKASILDDLDALRQVWLSRLADPTVLERTSAPQAAVVFGILQDKYLTEAGRPTSITVTAAVDVTMPELLGRLRRVIEGRVQAKVAKAEEGESAGDAGEQGKRPSQGMA